MSGQQSMPQELRDIWTDAYKLHAAFEHMGRSIEEFSECYDAVVNLYKKHDSHPLALKLALAVYGYLDESRRQPQDGAGGSG